MSALAKLLNECIDLGFDPDEAIKAATEVNDLVTVARLFLTEHRDTLARVSPGQDSVSGHLRKILSELEARR